MNKERYNQIIDEVYENWIKESWNGRIYPNQNNKEQFINRIKTDSKFSEKWGLKIEERELTTVQERKKYDNYFDDLIGEYLEHHETLDKRGVPRKITTLTYKNETVITYE